MHLVEEKWPPLIDSGGRERVNIGSESYDDGPLDVNAARYVISSGDYRMFTKDELLSWLSINSHHLTMEQTLAVGRVLIQLRDTRYRLNRF
jgi:hypothetical protein